MADRRAVDVIDSEKITINMGAVDLGKVDLLVDEGFYSNRSDFIRTAIRNQLDRHEAAMTQSVMRRAAAVGVITFGRKDLDEEKAMGHRLKISVVGMLSLAKDITPQLAADTIESVNVWGVFRASQEVKDAIADRIS